LVFSVLTFEYSGDNLFKTQTMLTWGIALLSMLAAFWEGELNPLRVWHGLRAWITQTKFTLHLSRWTILLVLGFAVVSFFRFTQLRTVPYEMWSDHAEKLLDVVDVLNGYTSIYFPRNTGREALQFYMAAATAKVLNTGISFMTLKIGTAAAGLLTIPFIYLFAKEIGGKAVGFVAMMLAGVAYWPNVISRIGLRFPLYPLFTAPAMFFLVRGIRRKSRNDFLLAGVAMGIALHGYSPARVIPLVFTLGVLVYLLHRVSAGVRSRVLMWLGLSALISILLFLPLLKVALDMPDMYLMRTLTRITDSERALPGPAGEILLSNIWNGLRMFNWDNGEIWVVSIPHRPSLDWVTGGFFLLGVVIVLVRYVRDRDWRDLFLLLSIPILLAPSILSLAFPAENPAPNRGSGAIVPVFTVAAIPLVHLVKILAGQIPTKTSRWVRNSVIGILVLVIGMTNYDLAIMEWGTQVRNGAWNTSEAGAVIRHFARSVGTFQTAHVIAYPHWMDTRLIGMLAGRPTKDYGIWPDGIPELPETSEAQLFLLNQDDEVGLEALVDRYPNGSLSRWDSAVEGRDFLMFFVPPESNSTLEGTSP
jgi:hypothetical protein